jgi:hypothetical protein
LEAAMAKRKAKTAKSATKKKKAPARRARVEKITFKCRSGRCTASHQSPKIGTKRDKVRLEAKNTSVEIDFPDGSPFAASHFSLQDGDVLRREIVGDPGEYEYDLSCGSCSRRMAGPPKMIVD